MNKRQAVFRVASYMAGLMSASALEECTGLTEQEQDRMSEADLARLEEAVAVVMDRLNRMGQQS